jgi:hypothetical protein
MTEQAPAPAPAPDPAQTIAEMRSDPAIVKALMDPSDLAHKHVTQRWNDAHAGKVEAPATGQSKIDAMRADPEVVKKLTAGDPATKAAWEAAHMGVTAADKAAELDAVEAPPEKPEGYKLDNVSMSVGAERADDELIATARGIAHAAQLSQSEFDGILVAWNTSCAGGEALSESEGVSKLVAQLGKAEADRVIIAAHGFVRSLPQAQRDAAIELLEDPALGNNPALIKHLALIADKRAARKAKAG